MTRTKNTITVANGTTTGSAVIHESGIIKSLVVITPDWNTGTPTTVLTIDDVDGYTLYTSNALAENTENLGSGLNVPIGKGWTINLTLSGDPGADGDAVVALYISETAVV